MTTTERQEARGREGGREGHLPVMYLMMVSGEVQSSNRTV